MKTILCILVTRTMYSSHAPCTSPHIIKSHHHTLQYVQRSGRNEELHLSLSLGHNVRTSENSVVLGT